MTGLQDNSVALVLIVSHVKTCDSGGAVVQNAGAKAYLGANRTNDKCGAHRSPHEVSGVLQNVICVDFNNALKQTNHGIQKPNLYDDDCADTINRHAAAVV